MKMDDAKPKIGKDSVRLTELVPVLKLTGTWKAVRILDSDILATKVHWMPITKKDGASVNIPKLCISFDPITEGERKGITCPYCSMEGVSQQTRYAINVIDRDAQENAPRKQPKRTKEEAKTGFKDAGSSTWTPVKVLDIPSSLMIKLIALKDLNKAKIKDSTKTFSISHPKYGIDVNIKQDPKGKGADMYQVQGGSRTPLDEEEQEFLVFDLNEKLLDVMGRETEKEAMAEVKRTTAKTVEDEDDDEDDVPSSKSKSKKKSKYDDDDVPSSKSKKKSKRDEDEDDEVSPKKTKKKSKYDDDEDDVPSSKSKSKKKSKYDDDDDDVPSSKSKSKKGSSSKKTSSSSKKKSKVDDDVTSSKSKSKAKKAAESKKTSSKSKSKKKSKRDDDDIPF